MKNQGWTSAWKDCLLLSLGISLFFGILLGQRFLQVPDEGRYVEIPREMLALHHYLSPQINGINYFEKPILFYWLEALGLKLGGLNLWAERIPTALMGLIGCLFTYIATRILMDRRSGIFAALILASSLLYFVMAHTITPDMLLSTLLTGTLLCFILGIQNKGSLRRRYFWAMYVFSALALLTKGFVGIIFPGLIIFTWIGIHQEWRSLKTCCLVSGLLIVLVIGLPWHIFMQLEHPEFFHYFIIRQQFLRYFTSVANRAEPFWFLPLVLFLGFLPWIFFLFQAIQFHWPRWAERNTSKNKISTFFLLWLGLIYIFFQFSNSQLMTYLLPIFPPMSILVGSYFSQLDLKTSSKGIRWGLWGLLTFSLLLCFSLFWLQHLGKIEDLWPGAHLKDFLLPIALLLILSGLGFLAYFKKSLSCMVLILSLGMGAFENSILLNPLAFEQKSTQPLVSALGPLWTPGDRVFSYEDYFQDLPVYLNQKVILVMDPNGLGELSFGAEHQSLKGILISRSDFWQQWKPSPPRMFIVLKISVYQSLNQNERSKLYVIHQTNRALIASNFPV